MDVSVIVVSYNTKDITIQCLDAIFLQTKNVEFEVILVDNASSDGSCNAIKELFPQTKIIESDKNLGFGRANNLGSQIAQGKYLFFLNSDTIIVNNAILYLLEFFESNPSEEYGAAGTLLLNNDLKPTHSSGRFPLKRDILTVTFLGYFDRAYFHKFQNKEKLTFENNSSFEVDYITGADLFISLNLFKRLNGFDTIYFMYYEDTDLQKRIKQLGLKRIIINGPKIIHLEGGSNKNFIFSIEKRIMVTKSMFLYFKKYSIPVSYFLFRVSYFLIRLPILLDKRISFNDRLKYLSFLMNERVTVAKSFYPSGHNN
jgi:GT2 family glycosyltransferase